MAENSFRTLYTVALEEKSSLTPKQRRVLEAALDLFAAQGFESTTTTQIAERANVAVGSVYQKFPNKQALLEAVLTPLMELIFPAAANEFIDHTLGNVYDSLDGFINALITDRMIYIHKNFKELKIMFGQSLISSSLIAQVKNTFAAQLMLSAAPTIENLKIKHLILDLPNDVIIQFILSPLAAYFGKLLLQIGNRDLDEDIAFTVKLVTAALRPEFKNTKKGLQN